MKILFIGPYRQDDGWGCASRAFLKSLTLTGHNISSAPVYLNSQREYRKFDDEFILNSESNRNEDYDVVIQNCLPHMFRKYGGVKNIGLSFFESTIDNSPWTEPLKLMDRMWVSSRFENKILNRANIQSVDIIPIPFDASSLDEDFEHNKVFNKREDEFAFYFVGENITRKNLAALIKAFHIEFKPYEQVKLVLKVNNVGKSDKEVYEEVTGIINNIKLSLGLYRDTSMYKAEFLITRFLSENDLRGLHKECDCFVMPSSGEGFCIPAFDAMVNNSWVIANENCSISSYIKEGENGSLVKSSFTPAIAPDRPLNFLYNGRDYWYEIDVDDLRKTMRGIYELKTNRKHKDEIKKYNRKHILPNYTFEQVAKDMEHALEKL